MRKLVTEQIWSFDKIAVKDKPLQPCTRTEWASTSTDHHGDGQDEGETRVDLRRQQRAVDRAEKRTGKGDFVGERVIQSCKVLKQMCVETKGLNVYEKVVLNELL